MSYDYTTEKAATKIVGDFADIKNADFKHCLENISEDFRVNSNYDIWDPANFYNTLKNEGLREEYKQQLLGDVFESAKMGETEFEKEFPLCSSSWRAISYYFQEEYRDCVDVSSVVIF